MADYYHYQKTYTLPPPESLPFPGNIIRLCADCDLRSGCKAPVPGIGPTPARVMLTGEAPGSNEDDQNKPFCGQAGRQLDSLLMQAGVPRDTCFINNCVRCRPPNNATPKPAIVDACAKWLDIEIELVNPEIIVAMGATAIYRFLGAGAGSVEHLHGKPIILRVGSKERILLPSYHPAAALHNTTLLRQLFDDFQVLRGLVAGRAPSEFLVKDEYPNPVYRVADTDAKLKQMLDEVRDVGECAVDVETIKRDTQLWSAQVSAIPGTAWFIPIKSGFKGRLNVKEWGAHIIVHHYLNDINWLDIPDGNFTDSMVQAYLIGQAQGLKELASRLCGISMVSYSEMVRPGQRKLSLEYLVEATKLDLPGPPEITETKWDNKAGKVVTKTKKPWHIARKIAKLWADTTNSIDVDPLERWNSIPDLERAEVEKVLGPMPESSLADIPFEQAVDYGSRDAQATLRVKHKMDKIIAQLGLPFVQHMDLNILPMVDAMMKNGMAVDIEHFRKLSSEYTVRMAQKAEELALTVGHPFNPNSSNQVATVVYGELGFKPTAFTTTKEISTDDQELKKTGHPVAKGIIEYRRLSKMKGTYADNLVKYPILDPSGACRIHTTLKTTRTETGRLSSAEPVNLQNQPTRSKEGKAIKKGFIAPEGWVLTEGDYKQMEVVVQAHMANCKGLIELFSRGGDPHTETAARIFGVPLDVAAQDKYRYPTKRAGFGVIYLIGAKGLADQIGEYLSDLEMEGTPTDIEPWTEQDCERFIADYFKLYPEIRDYQMEMAAMARRYGFTRDMFGRIRYIPEVLCPIRSIQESGLRMAANMPIQAGAQGIIKLAMGQLWREWVGSNREDRIKFLVQIHDSLIAEMRDSEDNTRDCLEWMKRVMTGVVKLRVSVGVDFKVGWDWATLEKYKL